MPLPSVLCRICNWVGSAGSTERPAALATNSLIWSTCRFSLSGRSLAQTSPCITSLPIDPLKRDLSHPPFVRVCSCIKRVRRLHFETEACRRWEIRFRDLTTAEVIDVGSADGRHLILPTKQQMVLMLEKRRARPRGRDHSSGASVADTGTPLRGPHCRVGSAFARHRRQPADAPGRRSHFDTGQPPVIQTDGRSGPAFVFYAMKAVEKAAVAWPRISGLVSARLGFCFIHSILLADCLFKPCSVGS